MNKHINKKRLVKVTVAQVAGLFGSIRQENEINPAPMPGFIQQVDHDGMPPEVATEMLCARGVRLTNRERKTCHAARSKYFVSTRTPKLMEDKLATRLMNASVTQLGKWFRRTVSRRNDTQSAYNSVLRQIERTTDEKLKGRLELWKATLADRAGRLTIVWDAIDTEVERRQNFCNAVRNVAPSVAEALQPKLVPA